MAKTEHIVYMIMAFLELSPRQPMPWETVWEYITEKSPQSISVPISAFLSGFTRIIITTDSCQ